MFDEYNIKTMNPNLNRDIKIIALLPMKGNSERVPDKNLKNFCGAPLYKRVLETLLESKYISQVIVNTDSDRIIGDIKASFGSQVIIHNRPESIRGDYVSMNEIINYDLTNSDGDFYFQTHSTNPLMKVESVDKSIEVMLSLAGEKTFDSVFSVTKIQTRLYDEHRKAVNHNPEELLRTQDLPPLFEENSNFYIFTKESFLANGKKRIGLNPYMFEIDKIEAVDIDFPEDFTIAEAIYKVVREK